MTHRISANRIAICHMMGALAKRPHSARELRDLSGLGSECVWAYVRTLRHLGLAHVVKGRSETGRVVPHYVIKP